MSGAQGNGTRGVAGEASPLVAQNERANMNVHAYGELVAFDPSTQQATVRLMHKPTVNGQPVDPLELTEVPVEQVRGGGGFCFTLPLVPGDKLRVQFNDKDRDAYFETGTPQQARTDRLNSLSDALAFPGGYPDPYALVNYDTQNLFIGRIDGVNGFAMDAQGQISFVANGEELMTILWELLNTLAHTTTTVGAGSSAGVWNNTQQSDYAALRDRLDKVKRL